jgi:hypothetical protein
MDATWPASAAIAILMIAQAQLARRQLGGWLAPGALFCLTWTTATVSSLLLAPEYRIWPGVLWVFFMTCTAHLGGLLVTAEPAALGPEPEEPLRTPPAFPLLLPLLCVSAALEVAGAIYLVQTIGKDSSSLLSLSGLGEIASHFSGARYTDRDYREPMLFLVSQVFIDFAGFLGGALFAQTRSKTRRAIALASVPAAMLGTLVIGARSVTVSFALCWLASYCAVRTYTGYRSPWHSTRRAYTWLILAVAAFTGFSIAALWLRMNAFPESPVVAPQSERQQDESTLVYALDTVRNQYVGYVGAFSTWFSENWDRSEPPGFGIYSFDGPAGWLGYSVVRNPEPIVLTPGSPASETNVFSMLRYMALDFTLPGSAVFLFLISVGASLAYTRARAGSVICISFTALFYRIALSVESFALRSTVSDLAWVMFALYLWIACSPGPEPEF